jgi:hypothetical protein
MAQRRSRHIRHRGPRSPRAPGAAIELDPAARLRALVNEGIIAAAALTARDHLELAAASTGRLGSLTSGMWRALSRELSTAAERLDVSIGERLDDLERRARVLDVDESQALVAGVAAGHLDSHRATIEKLVDAHSNTRALLAPNMLFGCGIEDPLVDDDELLEADDGDDDDDDASAVAVADDDESSPWTVRIWLFLWPAPLSPAGVTFIPALEALTEPVVDAESPTLLDVSIPVPLMEALTAATGLSSADVEGALTELAVQCWTAHELDDAALENDQDDDDDDASLAFDDPDR